MYKYLFSDFTKNILLQDDWLVAFGIFKYIGGHDGIPYVFSSSSLKSQKQVSN